jgi:hypothetical protein
MGGCVCGETRGRSCLCPHTRQGYMPTSLGDAGTRSNFAVAQRERGEPIHAGSGRVGGDMARDHGCPSCVSTGA